MRVLPQQHGAGHPNNQRITETEVRVKAAPAVDPTMDAQDLTWDYFQTLPSLGQAYMGPYELGTTIGYSDPQGVVARFLWIINTADSAGNGFYLELADVRVYASPQ